MDHLYHSYVSHNQRVYPKIHQKIQLFWGAITFRVTQWRYQPRLYSSYITLVSNAMIWWPFKDFDLKTFHRRWATESLTRLKPLATVSRSPQISPKFRTREYKTEFQSHSSPTITIFHQWSQFFPHGPVTSSSCRPWTPVFITRSLPAKSTRYSWAKRCFPGSTWKNIGNTWMLLGENVEEMLSEFMLYL